MIRYFLCFFLLASLHQNLSGQEKHLLRFTSNEGLLTWSAEDGKGGSSWIEGLNLHISLIDGADRHSFAPISYKSEYQLMTTDGFGGLTTFDQDGSGWRGHRLWEAEGRLFQLLCLEWFDYGLFNGMAMEIIGLRQGQQVGSFPFTGNQTYSSVQIRLPADFPAVDEVLIIPADPAQKTYPVINGITVQQVELDKNEK